MRVRWEAQFGLLAAIWGLSFLFIKVGDQSLAPLQVALARVLFGSATLLLVLAIRREALPRGWRLWIHLATAAFLVNVVPFSLFAYGETQVTSVAAGIWNATTPLLTLVVAMAVLPEERPTAQRVMGLGVGFAGVLVLLGLWHAPVGGALLGNLACLGAAAGYAAGFPYVRRNISGRSESVVAISAGQILCATVELAVITALFTHVPSSISVKVVGSVLSLGVLGTGMAYVLYFNVIRAAGATVASTVTYVIPLFATAAGVLLLGERLTWDQPVGGLIVLLGVALSQGLLDLSRFRRLRRSEPDRYSSSPGTSSGS